LNIGENTYRFSVLKNKENIPSLAAQVCNENAASLGLTTTADLEANCYHPVVQSLSEQVDLTLEQVIPVMNSLWLRQCPLLILMLCA